MGTLLILLVMAFESKSQSHIFPDLTDSLLSRISYHVYSEGQLGNLRDDLTGANFNNNQLKEFLKINNRKTINVIMLRTLTNKSSGKIHKIELYSVRRQDTKFIYELTLDELSNATDLKLLTTKLKL